MLEAATRRSEGPSGWGVVPGRDVRGARRLLYRLGPSWQAEAGPVPQTDRGHADPGRSRDLANTGHVITFYQERIAMSNAIAELSTRSGYRR